MIPDYVWIVETREESNPWTGERKGPWYPCGHKSHRTREDARKEISTFRKYDYFGPYRAMKYARKN